MKNSTGAAALLTVLVLLGLLTTFDAKAQSGIYSSPSDFSTHTLSYTSTQGSSHIRLNELFGSPTISVTQNGHRQTLSKDKVFGFRDKNGADYRFYHRSAYHILDTAQFYLYSSDKLVQEEKIARPETLYYFSAGPQGAILPLTRSNLDLVFSTDSRFRYMLDACLLTDKDLVAYDNTLNAYKIKYLYRESLKN